MAKPRQIKGNRTDADLSHSIRNTIFTITTLPPEQWQKPTFFLKF